MVVTWNAIGCMAVTLYLIGHVTLQEFVPQQAHLNRKSMKSRPAGEDGVTLTMLRKDDSVPPPQSQQSQRLSDSSRNTHNGRSSSRYEPALNPFGAEDGDDGSDFDTDMPVGDDADFPTRMTKRRR
ncbi:hypothetical protein EB796_005682 [Bugula neritina]|uniref:Uncharacterized protein n=1 Tax=Bugula neritina TaxID=10212 RepID=A0A7J7KCV2_BUGNE|nr:hypothetical protein EB796_005682 [Bugula neritina]